MSTREERETIDRWKEQQDQLPGHHPRKHGVGSDCGPHAGYLVEHGDEVVFLDSGIGDLVETLWTAGFETTSSCEELMPGVAYVTFPDVEQAEKFLALTHDEHAGTVTLADVPERRKDWEDLGIVEQGSVVFRRSLIEQTTRRVEALAG